MWPRRYFGGRYWAPRYWSQSQGNPPIGGGGSDEIILVGWPSIPHMHGINPTIGSF